MAEPGCVHDAHFNNLEVSGNLHIGQSSIVAETQVNNKSNPVTANGQVVDITMNVANLTANTTVSFTLTNSFININSIVLAQITPNAGVTATSYAASTGHVNAGFADIAVTNTTGGDLGEPVKVRVIVLGTVG